MNKELLAQRIVPMAASWPEVGDVYIVKAVKRYPLTNGNAKQDVMLERDDRYWGTEGSRLKSRRECAKEHQEAGHLMSHARIDDALSDHMKRIERLEKMHV